jgi:uncharacterized protein YjiS (DUF1127 family)
VTDGRIARLESSLEEMKAMQRQILQLLQSKGGRSTDVLADMGLSEEEAAAAAAKLQAMQRGKLARRELSAA